MSIIEWLGRLLGFSNIIESQESEINKLKSELNNYQTQIDYSFIPNEWTQIFADVTTSKTMQDGIALNLDIRDLFNSTIYSRKWAEQIINKVGPKLEKESYDSYFNKLALETANQTIENIQYVTNQEQFNVADKWTNGDSAIVTMKGDCDISVRVFVRVMLDILDRLKMFEYKKYVFQCIGYFNITGHSWAMIYDPIDKEFKLIECTLNLPYNELPKIPKQYHMFFCLNFKNIWKQNNEWGTFL